MQPRRCAVVRLMAHHAVDWSALLNSPNRVARRQCAAKVGLQVQRPCSHLTNGKSICGLI